MVEWIGGWVGGWVSPYVLKGSQHRFLDFSFRGFPGPQAQHRELVARAAEREGRDRRSSHGAEMGARGAVDGGEEWSVCWVWVGWVGECGERPVVWQAALFF